MDLFTAPGQMRAWSRGQRAAGSTVGVVPTMGALHRGHLALVEAVRERVDVVVVTIFVNPLQFNQSTDFDAYPRPIDDDLAVCEAIGVDAVYAPTSATMYGPSFQTHVEPGELAVGLEGPMRPGHFRGVATVVTKLFGAIEPDVAAFGRKDYQQLAIVRRMVDDLDLGVEILGVPIVREPDGLALSSRNARLEPDDRRAAVVLSRALGRAVEVVDHGERDAARIERTICDAIEAEPRARLEYASVVDESTLEPVAQLDSPAVALVAAWFGDVRLIDNAALDAGDR